MGLNCIECPLVSVGWNKEARFGTVKFYKNTCPLLLRICTVWEENVCKFQEIKCKASKEGVIVTVTIQVAQY